MSTDAQATDLRSFWVTFGIGTANAGYVVEIRARTRGEAESKMFASKYGQNWAFLYSSLEKVDDWDKRKGTLEVLE